MNLDIQEGEVVALPCRHCASLTIRLRIRAGLQKERCSRCGGSVWFDVGRGPGGMSIRPQFAGPPPRKAVNGGS